MRWRKAKLFWPIVLVLVMADCSTKRVAESELDVGQPESVIGEVVRFTLAYNPGVAFGIRFGEFSRGIVAALAVAGLLGLAWMYRATRPGQRGQVLALALISGGAVGNLIDRLLSARGVVDFIDVGLGGVRFWTFNVADVGITTGALLFIAGSWAAKDADRPDGC